MPSIDKLKLKEDIFNLTRSNATVKHYNNAALSQRVPYEQALEMMVIALAEQNKTMYDRLVQLEMERIAPPMLTGLSSVG